MTAEEKVAQRTAFGQALVALGDRYPQMLVLDPDVGASTQTILFKKAYPDRFYPTGIAEANTIGMAAGLATCGYQPWVSTFAVFLSSRAADQIRVSVASAKLPVKINGAYGGLPTGRAGSTHSAIEDIAVFRAMPNMIILTPADAREVFAMTDLAMQLKEPVYLRTVRCEVPNFLDSNFTPTLGKAVELHAGKDVAILSEGMMSYRALKAAEQLAKKGMYARVLHFGSIKPIDREAIIRAAKECGLLITVENHSIVGGLGGAVCEIVTEEAPCRVARMGFPDIFMESGDDEAIFARHGLNVEGIRDLTKKLLDERMPL